MTRDSAVVAPNLRETTQAQRGAFNPREYEAVPEPGQIPPPSITAEQLGADCLRYFNNASYSGNLTIETPRDKTRTAFWPTVIFAKFKTTGKVSLNSYLKRPACPVDYSWLNPYGGQSEVLRSHFDGRWLMGRNYIMEARGRSLILTTYPGDGRRGWGIYERD
jgi:hypothetical protein